MEFNSSAAVFSKKRSFTDSMKRFVSEEAAIFSHEDEEAAAASVDKTAEKIVRFSADKNKSKAREYKSMLKSIKAESKVEKEPGIKTDDGMDSVQGETLEIKDRFVNSKTTAVSDRKCDVSRSVTSAKGMQETFGSKRKKDPAMDKFTDPPKTMAEGFGNASYEVKENLFSDAVSGDMKSVSVSAVSQSGIKKDGDRFSSGKEEMSLKESVIKSARSKEVKKAAAKTAVANMLKAKADMSNDLATDKVTGDAFKDGNSGLVKTFTTVINPMTYVKKYLAKIGAIIAPYILIFTTIAAVVLVIVALLFSVLQPISEVGDALSGFVGMFNGNGGGLRNTSFSDAEIDKVVEKAGANKKQEKVIRFALSKVGYPYSQDLRTSGRAYDCSSLAYYSWEHAGVDISYGTNYPPTAAEGARMLEADGRKVSAADLKPGDLIYYGGEANGRYLGIYHVAIYVGDGMAVEALCTKYGVVYQPLRTKNACMICRPK